MLSAFPVQNCLKQGCFGLTALNFVLLYATEKVWKNQEGLELIGLVHEFLHADGINFLGKNINNISSYIVILLPSNKEINIEVNINKT